MITVIYKDQQFTFSFYFVSNCYMLQNTERNNVGLNTGSFEQQLKVEWTVYDSDDRTENLLNQVRSIFLVSSRAANLDYCKSVEKSIMHIPIFTTILPRRIFLRLESQGLKFCEKYFSSQSICVHLRKPHVRNAARVHCAQRFAL